MDKAILNLEKEFQRIVGELEFHAHRLEKDWGGDDYRGALNPIKLFKRIKALERQLPVLQKQYRANMRAKQEAIACLPQMVDNMKALKALKTSIGFTEVPTEENDDGDAFDDEAEGATTLEDDCQAAEALVAAWQEDMLLAAAEANDSAGFDVTEGEGLAGEGGIGAAASSLPPATAAGVLQDSKSANVGTGLQTFQMHKKVAGAEKLLLWESVDEREFDQLPESVRGACGMVPQ
jgi:hypothetical protein